MPQKPSIALVSLGCPKNLVDSQFMLGYLEDAGYPIVDDAVDAGVIIVNTCAFIESAQQEAIEAILDLADLKKDGCRALVCAGCLVERHGRSLLDQLPEVDAFVGCGGIPRIVEAVEKAVDGERVFVDGPLPYLYDAETPWLHTGPQWSAYLKIAEGCNHRCTFCLIPQLRGGYRSIPPAEIRRRFQQLVADDVREIILIGQDTTAYGTDLQARYSLSRLLGDLATVEFDGWVRVMYMHPDTLDTETIATICDESPVVPYFDLPMQHADSQILKKMGRKGNADKYIELIEGIREHRPKTAVRTTLMVGFPGEGSEEFQALLDFVQRAKFDRLSVFRYWPEEGVAATDLPDPVPEYIADRRLDELMRLQEDISWQANQKFIGETMRVLVERKSSDRDIWYGRSYRDAPDIDAEVRLTADSDGVSVQAGQFVNAQIEDAEVHDLHGAIIT